MRRLNLRSSLLAAFRGLGLALTAWTAASCQQPIDTTRQIQKATLGDDLYGLLCDRVGASSFTEDLNGQSYQSICHFDSNGNYGDKVDTSVLPPVTGQAAQDARRRSIAKLETMARRRSDLIHAFNATFPDIDIDNVATDSQGDTLRLHDALFNLAQTMAPLYEQNPVDPNAPPLFPTSTQSLGRLFNAFAESQPARESLSKIWGRQGYRPTSVVLGAIRAALSYPNLRDLTKTSVQVLGPQGEAVPQLQQLLTVAKQEFLTASTNVSPLPPLQLVDPNKKELNRPRTNIEVMAALLNQVDDSFALNPSVPSSYIVQRDRRGFASATAASFSDTNGDGFADVDAFGRFVDSAGTPLAIDPPFVIPGIPSLGPVDQFGRPTPSLYNYIDTSRTMNGALARTLRPLVDATQYVAPGDPEAYKSEHEGLMYAMAGAYMLYGDRENATYDYNPDPSVTNRIFPAGTTCANCVPYQRFRGEDSPMADLAHAVGQILADEDSDAILLGLADLIQNHEPIVSRLIGAALRAREIAAEHDQLAAQGKEPLAEMPYETPIWDEVAQLLSRITDRPDLTKRLLQAFGDPALVTPATGQGGPGANHVGDTLARQLRCRDEMTYYPNNINGLALNVTVSNATGQTSFDDPKTPVDQTQPKTGTNRSIMQRSLQIIHDAYEATACNKQDAELYVLGIHSGSFPLFITFSECSLFEFQNIATFYVDSMLPPGHPKKAQIQIKNGVLSFLLDFANFVGLDLNGLFEDGSQITGLTLTPTTQALNRLVFFGADSTKYPNLPDLDPYRSGLNLDTNEFISSLIEPASSYVCPKNGNGNSDCPNMEGLLRIRDRNTIFTWERLGFYDYLRPVVTEFADEPCAQNEGADCGEAMFADLIRILNRHWPGADHGSECSKSGTPQTNPRYCSEAGVNTYEALTADVMETDLIPAVVEFSKAVTQLSTITIQRGPKAGQVWTGADVLQKVTRILFNQSYAASVNMVDRQGKKSATWVDGTPQSQLTAFNLFADALHKFDVRLDQAGDPIRKGQWKRARSELVDTFFAIDGSGPTAKFKNTATPKMLLTIIDVLREQLNTHCPNRETTKSCPWAKQELGNKVAETLSGPLFAGMMDVQEAIRADEPARRELNKFLSYLFDAASQDPSFLATLASLNDIVQIVANDDVFAPIFQAAANAASPQSDKEGPGCADTTIKVLQALTDDKYDRYHSLDHILKAVVTPMDGEQGPAPIEVFMDVIAEVNRIDADSQQPLTPDDYKTIFGTVRDFFIDDTRGLEQFYTIVQNRPHE